MMKKFFEETKNLNKVYEGKIIDLELHQVILPNGKLSTREIVRHPGAVAVLPLTNEGKAIMIEQYRKPLERSIIEIPAGKLEKGENPLESAKRELQEETGYTSDNFQAVASFYTSPGFADEIIHLFIAYNCQPGELSLDEDEFLEPLIVSKEEAFQLIADQKIYDAKTILAVYYWDLLDRTSSS
jgi:ADP-ribose pyrophosphatase